MTIPSEHVQALYQWLESPETYIFLTRFVDTKSRKDIQINSGRDDHQEDLCHEFLLYVLDSFLIESRMVPELIALIRSAQFRRILELAWGRFIWQRREHERRKHYNPRGYLYRRLREILKHNNQRFVVTSNPQGFLFYCLAGNTAEHLRPFWHQEAAPAGGYAQWSPPPSMIGLPPEKYLFKDKWLLSAAEYFWQQALERTGQPAMMPIRELCRYLADHYPWLNKPMRQDRADSDGIEDLADERENPEEYLQQMDGLQSVAPLAAQLVATWPVDQRRVFALRLADPPIKYAEIAERFGLPDHNKAYALYRKAEQSLRLFTGNWPGLPLAELPEKVAQAFIEEMKQLCKNSLLCP